MEIKETLKALCEADGVSGGELNASKAALALLAQYAPDASIDHFGNVTAFIGDKSNGKPTLLLDAHIDEIGLIVTYIDDKGFIKVANCGGIDRRLLLAQTVTIWGKKPVKGVISTLPPHVASDSDKAAKLEDIAIDTGFTKEQLEEIVSLGDKITFDAEFSDLCGDKVTGKAIDDRSGVASILYALELLRGAELKFNLAVQFAVQEEVGGRGAKIAAYNAEPDFAIAVDVSFARTPGVEAWKAGKMGDGAMIGVAAALDRDLSDRLIALAKERDIPFQREVMGGDTGTDADDIAATRSGVRTMLISIPQKYMHTPAEVVDLKDVKAVGALIAAFAEEGAY